MKTGAGENPFGGSGDGGDERSDADADEETGGSAADAPADERPDADGESADADSESGTEAPDLPWAVRRDGPKSDRPHLIQMFAQEETKEREKRFRADVEGRLGNDVYKTDLREAAYLIAMEHPEEVAEKLEEWGCEHV